MGALHLPYFPEKSFSKCIGTQFPSWLSFPRALVTWVSPEFLCFF